MLVPVGSTGEFYSMSDKEHRRVIHCVVDEVGGEVPVFAGTPRAGTLETLWLSRYAQEVGADGVQVVLPYYHIASEEGMYQHFKSLAEGLDIGIMVYNNPAVSGSWIRPPLMARIAELDNIIADKENTPNIIQYYQMQRAVDPAKMAILCGLGEMMFTFECVYGCPGFITWLANLAPSLSYDLYEAAEARDMEGVRKWTLRVGPLFDFVGWMDEVYGPHSFFVPGIAGMSGYMYVSVAKAAMDLCGLVGGKVRLPLLDLQDEHIQALRDVLAQVGIPVGG
jgi:4-hydroxy-tetrahydrodipicolinate synthase